MPLTAFYKLGQHRESPRLWIESGSLARLGFTPGTGLHIQADHNRLVITRSDKGSHRVSFRRACNSRRPIIDLNSAELLAPLSAYEEIKVRATDGQLVVAPSMRAFAIHRGKNLTPPFRVLEIFAGGGTLTNAFRKNPDYRVAAGIEINPNYADVWSASHPDAELILADVRGVHPSELPAFDVLAAGIPCTCHSLLGRTKNRLSQSPELGDEGDLFIPVLGIVASRMPAVCVFENVPNFGDSLAGKTITGALTKLGYSVTTHILQPNAEWGEISDRKRWLCIATLKPGFVLQVPGKQFSGRSADFLDRQHDVFDAADATRIAGAIAGLQRHHERHKENGNGFFRSFTTLAGDETSIGTVVKSYHKINVGPFVETKYGLRQLRQSELERIMGSQVATDHYATAVEVLGQGVQTRIFREIFQQIGNFLGQ